jgi:RNA-binding protein 23/39
MEEQVGAPRESRPTEDWKTKEDQERRDVDRHERRRRRRDEDGSRSPQRRRRRSRSRDDYDDRRREGRSRSYRRDGDRDRYSRRQYDDDEYDRRSYKRSRTPERWKAIRKISVEDEIAQLDRTMRTVQVFNLNLKADERDLFTFFSKAGSLVDIKIIRDRQSGRSKGFAYVEFAKKDGVLGAMSLSGQELKGQPVMVKPSEAEKNVAWHAAQAAKKAQQEGGTLQESGGKVKLSNIHPSLTEDFLKPIFEPFGPVFSVNLDASKGSAIVQFVHVGHAAQAVTELKDKVDIQGMVMRLELVESSQGLLDANSKFVEERIDVDADDGGGLRLSAQSRVELMNKLAANAGIEVPKLPQTWIGQNKGDDSKDDDISLVQGVLGPASPIPTTCVLIKNAFDPTEENEPSWDEDIRGDIREECSKFGDVLFVHVDKDSSGFVYLKFGDAEAAIAAQKALHKRWYNQKRLYVEFQFVPLFDKHFDV